MSICLRSVFVPLFMRYLPVLPIPVRVCNTVICQKTQHSHEIDIVLTIGKNRRMETFGKLGGGGANLQQTKAKVR